MPRNLHPDYVTAWPPREYPHMDPLAEWEKELLTGVWELAADEEFAGIDNGRDH